MLTPPTHVTHQKTISNFASFQVKINNAWYFMWVICSCESSAGRWFTWNITSNYFPNIQTAHCIYQGQSDLKLGTDCLPTETYFKIERQIHSRRVIVRMLSGTCRVFDLRSRDRDSNLTGSTALCLIVCEQDVHPLHSTGSTQEDPRGGTLIFSTNVGSDPASTIHPPKKSGISSTPKKYLKF